MKEEVQWIEQLEANISSVVLGKCDVVRRCIVALLAGEHVLLEDVPGVGKTLVGKAMARSVSGEFRRIQFTPDLLPADITGSSIFDSQRQEFVFTAARSSPTLCWPTKSTGQPPYPESRFSRR